MNYSLLCLSCGGPSRGEPPAGDQGAEVRAEQGTLRGLIPCQECDRLSCVTDSVVVALPDVYNLQ